MQDAKLFAQLGDNSELSPEWNRLRRILGNTRKKGADASHEALEAELDAMEAALLPGGKGLPAHIASREREVIRETIGKELGLGKDDLAKLSDEAVEGLGMMSEAELKALKGKTIKEVVFEGTKKEIRRKSNTLGSSLKIDLLEEERLGGHSIERHGPHLTMQEMEQRVMGTHSTLGQSRSALRFENVAVHVESTNAAYDYYRSEIDAHFKAGGDYREWEFEFGSITGSGYSNTGTRSNPIRSSRITSTKVKIAFEPDVNSPRGYKLVSSYPSYP